MSAMMLVIETTETHTRLQSRRLTWERLIGAAMVEEHVPLAEVIAEALRGTSNESIRIDLAPADANWALEKVS